jgi:hypothetical protein
VADRVPKITQEQKPTFDAAVYSDRLQETRQADGRLPAVQVFDKTSPSSIVPLARYVDGKLTDTVNALTEFTAAHEKRLNTHDVRLDTQLAAISSLRAEFDAALASPPFPA